MKTSQRVLIVLAAAIFLFGGIVGWLLGQPQPQQGYTVIIEENQ